MPINAIRSGDIFEARLLPGEERNGIQIAFGINTKGTNKDAHSVASQVAEKYDQTFREIPQRGLVIGDVYSGTGFINPALPTRFHGIVCNDKGDSGKHDWTYADLGVKEGFEKLEAGIVVPKFTVTSRMDYFREQMSELLKEKAPFHQIQSAFKDTEATLHPPVRAAFIGTGPSGTSNDADWRGILESMNNSSLNIILYLWNQEVQQQVAAIVKKFPKLREVRPLEEIEETYGIAA